MKSEDSTTSHDLQSSHDAREVANFLLDIAQERQRLVTQITLQKILYFAHAWFLVRRNRPLINEQFEAWEYGPVVRSIHEQFRDHRDSPIEARATKLNFNTGLREPVTYLFDNETGEALERIFDFYSRYKPFELVDMTHDAGGPWDQIYKAAETSARVGMRIPDSLIQSHFAIYYANKLFN